MGDIDYKLHQRKKYADPSPYPEIKVVQPNLKYANILIDDYAGMVSEFTAISQYLYHFFFFKLVDKDLGELLRNISIIEMLHMEILADLIIKLGGNPIIRGSYSTNNHYWSGNFVFYGKELCERLKADIDSEYKAIHQYNNHIQIIHDPYIQKILGRIILDEIVHIKLFNKAILKACGYTYRPWIQKKSPN